MRIRAVTFDFWGTLFRDAQGEERHALRVRALTEATRTDPVQADAALREVMHLFMRHHLETQHTLTPHDAAWLACRMVGALPDDFTLETLAAAFGNAILECPPRPIVDALHAVRTAAECGPTAVISDTGFSPGINLRVLMEREGFLPYFTALTFSDEMGMAKPQSPMFERTAEQLGVSPHDMLHIGDLEPTDIRGIHQATGHAGLFTGVNDRYRAATRADVVFDRWAAFISRLPVWAECN